jgi:hypothetical protein
MMRIHCMPDDMNIFIMKRTCRMCIDIQASTPSNVREHNENGYTYGLLSDVFPVISQTMPRQMIH